MADWWMLSGTTSTEATGAPVMKGQADEMDGTELASCSVTEAKLADGAVTVGKIGAAAVTSEKASANLLRKSVVVPIPIDPAAGAGYGATDLGLWVAPVPVRINTIRVIPLTAWQLTTCGEGIEIWSCAAGAIVSYCATSTAAFKTANVPVTFGAIASTGAQLAACEVVRIGLVSIDTCSNVGLGSVQIDYTSTD
jgi:hypothetical protein